jgi:ATP-binding cassette subfamily C protein CydD
VALTFQTSLFVLLLAPEFYQPLRDLGTLYHARAEALASAGQLKPILDAVSPSPAGGTATPGTGAPSLSLRGLSFSHMPSVPVLRDLDLEVKAGEAVAVTGPSGVGKTTLLRLLQGQLTPEAGGIWVDGRPLVELDLEAWRARIGWMSQHPRLLAATLRDNLRVARQDAGDDELAEALTFAGLRPWLAALENGLDTLLGEGGRTVSGGQLRRLALARLRLRREATLLLLDEPTASLDDDTQDLVLDRLAELRRGRTLVLLTHHPKPLVLADRVFALGPVTEDDE